MVNDECDGGGEDECSYKHDWCGGVCEGVGRQIQVSVVYEQVGVAGLQISTPAPTPPHPQHYFHDTEQKYANALTEFMNGGAAGTSCVSRPAPWITSLAPLLYRNV